MRVFASTASLGRREFVFSFSDTAVKLFVFDVAELNAEMHTSIMVDFCFRLYLVYFNFIDLFPLHYLSGYIPNWQLPFYSMVLMTRLMR